MKITFVLPGVFIAGGIRAVFECSNRLIDRGHEVNIVHPVFPLEIHCNNHFKRFILHFVVFWVRFLKSFFISGNVKWFPLKAKLMKIPFLNSQMVSYFERYIPDADLIVATTWESAEAVSKLSAAKGKKGYFVQHYEVVDMWDSPECWAQADKGECNSENIFMKMFNVHPSNQKIRKLKKRIDKTYLLPLSKFTTSSVLEELILSGFKQKSFGKVPIGNNFDIFYPEGEKDNSNTILMPFRGVGWKGGLDGLEALQIVKETIPNIKVEMYGPAHYKEYLPAWITFLGVVSDDLLRNLYSTADIFISPTWVEGWGSPPMEAMACRTACITTNVGAVEDYAIDQETALIVPPKKSKKMAEAILFFINNKEKRASIAQKGYEYIQKFTWDKSI